MQGDAGITSNPLAIYTKNIRGWYTLPMGYEYSPYTLLDDGFKDSLFSPLLLEMIPLDLIIIFQMGWFKPPTCFFSVKNWGQKIRILLLMVQKCPTTTWDGAKTIANNGISTTILNGLAGFQPSTVWFLDELFFGGPRSSREGGISGSGVPTWVR